MSNELYNNYPEHNIRGGVYDLEGGIDSGVNNDKHRLSTETPSSLSEGAKKIVEGKEKEDKDKYYNVFNPITKYPIKVPKSNYAPETSGEELLKHDDLLRHVNNLFTLYNPAHFRLPENKDRLVPVIVPDLKDFGKGELRNLANHIFSNAIAKYIHVHPQLGSAEAKVNDDYIVEHGKDTKGNKKEDIEQHIPGMHYSPTENPVVHYLANMLANIHHSYLQESTPHFFGSPRLHNISTVPYSLYDHALEQLNDDKNEIPNYSREMPRWLKDHILESLRVLHKSQAYDRV